MISTLMPRLLQSVVTKAARNFNPYLSLLLKETRTIESAENELRWLKEHVQSLRNEPPNSLTRGLEKDVIGSHMTKHHVSQSEDRLLDLCRRRAKGEPLQYILGSQPFGDLDIKCEPGVLIPRPETEAYTMHLASEILDGSLERQMDRVREVNGLGQKSLGTPVRSKVKILDACSGSGCISLLLYNLLSDHIDVQIDGIDVSEKALNLSRRNLERNITSKGLKPDARSHVRFRDENILSFTDLNKKQIWDEYNIIISNPPYISREEYDTQIPHSVRDWEPELALVPTISPGAGNHSDVHPADIFYKVLILMYQTTWRRNVMLVLEIGDEEQAKRVIAMAILKFKVDDHSIVRVWRDSPDIRPSGEHLEVEGRKIPTEGQGNVRAVVFVRERFQKDTMGISSGVNT